jgi:hypothetical protein
MNRKILQNEFVDELLDSMTFVDLYQVAFDSLHSLYNDYDDKSLTAVVKEYYPHLLDNYETDK